MPKMKLQAMPFLVLTLKRLLYYYFDTRLFHSLYQLKAVRAGDLRLLRGNGNLVTGKERDTR